MKKKTVKSKIKNPIVYEIQMTSPLKLCPKCAKKNTTKTSFFKWTWVSKKLILAVVFLFLFSHNLFAQPVQPDFNKLADAIYLAEGGAKTRFPYGIKSVKCSGEAKCRKICLNTLRNNWRRWQSAGNPGTYLDFLASRYAPVDAKNDNGTNQFWKHNVEVLYGRA